MILVLSICQLVVTLALSALVLLARAYAQEKGKNLATKEDIADITRQVEEVKAEYARQGQVLEHTHQQLLKQSDQTHQLSLAAIDLRLKAHQEAFSRCNDFFELAFGRSPDWVQKMNESRRWWLDNCLYLSPEAAKAFLEARAAAAAQATLLDGGLGAEEIRENRRQIQQAVEVIATAVRLPGIGTQLAQFSRLGTDGQPSSAADGAPSVRQTP